MKICVVGSMNMDYRLLVDHLPLPGETILSLENDKVLGGKGLNQAVAARRSGAEVRMVSAIGEDEDGRAMMDLLQGEGIGFERIKKVDGPSGRAYILVEEVGENSIIVSPGSNFKLRVEDIDEVKDYILEADYCILQMEIPLEAIYRTIDLSHEGGVQVVMNPAPENKDFDRAYLKKIVILVVNETELELLSEENDMDRGLDQIHSMGVGTVIYTVGSAGSYLSMVKNEEAKPEVDFMPARKVDAVDTTAAGDTFIGALMSKWKEEAPLEAMEYATNASAIAVTREGAIPSIPCQKEILEFMKK